jgi:glutamate-1-semialdehyde 2,1-aminomutase
MSTTIGTSKLTLDEQFTRQFAGSAARFVDAVDVFPNGATHDGRAQKPFPLYIERAEGAYKWDVDGNRFIDFLVGHGSLLLGHGHPAVVEAVQAQMERGTHHGAAHECEIEWGRRVQQLIPSAERVRFTGSGTEATLMCLRLARAYSGKSKVIKFEHHFHGWHDYVVVEEPPAPPPAGVPAGTAESMIVLPVHDVERLERVLRDDPDIAAVILEPTGAGYASYPLDPDFLAAVRKLTLDYGVLMIMDEVITGFRCSPGGAQAATGVIPDLTSLAKILAGGLPGGAVAGRADILAHLEYRDEPEWNSTKKIRHQGTFNANPLSASAGTTALAIVAEGWPARHINDLAALLRDEMNQVMDAHGLSGCVFGTYSMFHIALYNLYNPHEKLNPDDRSQPFISMRDADAALYGKMKRGLQVNGIDLMGDGGMLCTAHTEDDVREAVAALDRTIDSLKQESAIPGVS